MCLGIPGRLTQRLDHEHLARVEVNGVARVVNIGLLEDEDLAVGDWVLIHVGFAMAKIDEDEAARALEGLRLLGGTLDEELLALDESPAADPTRASRG